MDREDLNRIARSLAIYDPEKQTVKCDGEAGFAYTHFTKHSRGLAAASLKVGKPKIFLRSNTG